jgi:hypothetical protein
MMIKLVQFLAIVLFAHEAVCAESESPRIDFSSTEIGLCNALMLVAPGDNRSVVISGVYVVSAETQVLYDPAERLCVADVQPVTWVELPDTLKLDTELERLLAQDGRAWVTMKGTLCGPRPIGPDDLMLPPMVAYANRIARRRYGHLSMFRTQLVVDEIVSFKRVPPSLPSYGQSGLSRRIENQPPSIVSGRLPRYPTAALSGGLSGVVVVLVTVSKGAVTATDVQFGDRLLVTETLETIKSWQFDAGVTASFTTVFAFELERRRSGGDKHIDMRLHLPSYARITAPADEW